MESGIRPANRHPVPEAEPHAIFSETECGFSPLRKIRTMHPELRQAFEAHMTTAIALYREGKLADAFQHLEVAHVLGQRHVGPHVATHYWMLRVGAQRGSFPEVM